MSLFPTDDKARKMLPIFKMVCGYFPKAMREITKVCVANNVRYNPERDPADINWARGKSPDQLGSAFRHIFERQVDGTVFEPTSGAVEAATGIGQVYVLAEAAWRICAALELEIETQECKVPVGTLRGGAGGSEFYASGPTFSGGNARGGNARGGNLGQGINEAIDSVTTRSTT